MNTRNAEVAELVDALGSGSSGRSAVGVRVSPSAPNEDIGYADVFSTLTGKSSCVHLDAILFHLYNSISNEKSKWGSLCRLKCQLNPMLII